MTLQFPIRLPVPSEPGSPPTTPPLPLRSFTLTGYTNGTATAAFNSSLGGAARIFLSPFSLLSGGVLQTGAVMLPYPAVNPHTRLLIFVYQGGASARTGWAGSTGTATAEDQEMLTMLSNSRSALLTALSTPPPVSITPVRPRLDDHGLPDRLFYRVTETVVDSDHDGVADNAELANSLNQGYTGNASDPSRYDPGNGGMWDGFNDLAIAEIVTTNDGAWGVLTETGGALEYPDYVEIFNPTASQVNLGTYYLSDRTTNLRKFAFPAGSALAAGARAVVLCRSSNAAVTATLPAGIYAAAFTLEATPELVVLSRQDTTTPANTVVVDAVIPGPGSPRAGRCCPLPRQPLPRSSSLRCRRANWSRVPRRSIDGPLPATTPASATTTPSFATRRMRLLRCAGASPAIPRRWRKTGQDSSALLPSLASPSARAVSTRADNS